jgi:signal transduction histidine kinase
MRSAAKLQNIIYSLLEIGRSEAGHISLQRFNIVQCVTEVIADAFETTTCKTLDVFEDATVLSNNLENNGIYLDVSPEVENVCLHQDKTKFMFILGNLIRNGLAHRKSKVMVQLMLKVGYLLISVSDDGPGVRPEYHDDLFRCYANNKKQQSTNRGKGHSLGLAGSRILSRYLGGDIVLSDQFTGGAEFILHLPLEFDDQGAGKKG